MAILHMGSACQLLGLAFYSPQLGRKKNIQNAAVVDFMLVAAIVYLSSIFKLQFVAGVYSWNTHPNNHRLRLKNTTQKIINILNLKNKKPSVNKLGFYFWCTRQELNLQPSESESEILSVELRVLNSVPYCNTFDRIWQQNISLWILFLCQLLSNFTNIKIIKR